MTLLGNRGKGETRRSSAAWRLGFSPRKKNRVSAAQVERVCLNTPNMSMLVLYLLFKLMKKKVMENNDPAPFLPW